MATENPITRVVSAGGGWVTVVDSSGATVTRTGARNWRNNNPGNLAAGYKGGAAQGVVGHDKYGDPVFATFEQGQEAQRQLLFGVNPTAKNKYWTYTLQEAFTNHYLGSAGNYTEAATGQTGQPEAYIKAILAAVPGITRNTVLGTLTREQQNQLMAASAKQEGYKAGTITVVIPPAGGGNTTPPNDKPSEESGGTTTTSTSGTPSSASSFAPDEQFAGTPLPNKLKEYASYIYGLSLHLMTDDQYNKVVIHRHILLLMY